jgi:serine/threonine protein kinase
MTTSDTVAGERLIADRYRLQTELGRGGMGVVWAAHDELLQRPVAVKQVHFPPTVSDEERETLRERTMREARAAARLDHHCAVRVFDVCEDEGEPFIVMEMVVGLTLSDLVREQGPISPARAAEIGLCLLDALEAAHAAGIVHRDVKPGNVLIRADGRVTLTDFGIASTAGDPSITSTGLLLGSPAYIAPERARGCVPEPPSDLWSLGATLYTAVEGRPPFDKPEPFATLTSVVIEPHTPCELAGEQLGPILDRLLDKDPDARPEPAQIRELLSGVAADPDAREVNGPPPPARVRARTGGHTVALPPALDADADDAATTGIAPATGPVTTTMIMAWVLLAIVVFGLSATIAAFVHSH